jgi:6-pyruvoyltetrahydropterin/6-carboxytetrahydropterin synthase
VDVLPMPLPQTTIPRRPAAVATHPPATERRYGNSLDKQYFSFAAAHFLVFADGSREPLHGHNYRAELEIEADLDGAGLVADFIAVKPLFRAACDALDHKVLIAAQHPLLKVRRSVDSDGEMVHVVHPQGRFALPVEDVVLLDLYNTSSELLADWLADFTLARIAAELPDLRLRALRVLVSESPGQAAWTERRWTPAT